MYFNDRTQLIRHTITLSIITALLLVISFAYLDLMVANFFNSSEMQNVYYYSREITNVGYSIHYFMAALIGLIFSKWIHPKSNYFKQKISTQKNDEIYSWSLFSLKALLIIGILLNILKFIIGRQRPHASADFSNLNFDMFTTHSHWHSFPSGHSQVVFTVATLLYLIWPRHKYIFILLAILFALTRVTIHQHFLSDMLAGSFIGYIATLWLYHLWPPQHLKDIKKQLK